MLANIALMRIWYANLDAVFYHKQVAAAGIRAVKT